MKKSLLLLLGILFLAGCATEVYGPPEPAPIVIYGPYYGSYWHGYYWHPYYHYYYHPGPHYAPHGGHPQPHHR